MKKITDEILNKYIDDELSASELDQIKDLIANDNESLNQLKAHKLADQILRKLDVTPAPQNFTERVMDKIYNAAPVKVRNSYFVHSVIGFFVLCIVGMLGYALSLPSVSAEPDSKTVAIMDSAKELVSQKVGDFASFFNNETILIAGSFLTFVLLLSAFFMISSHKKFTHELDKFGH